MFITEYQSYLMECLGKLRCMRVDQLEWLMRLKFSSTSKQVESDIHQLRYMGRLCRKENLILSPGCERDGQLIAAIDIMQLLSKENLPQFTIGSAPVKLAFYLEDERGYLDFKIVPVPPGDERKVMLMLEPQLTHFICTCIFVLQHENQIPRLAAVPRSYFALPDGKGGYSFLKAGKDMEGGDASRE